ncbi:MAG: DUF4397 domain-containing protein [Bacteroidota bacterium]
MRAYTAVFLLAMIILAGCNDEPEDVIPPVRERSFLHIVGGAETASFDITFDYFNADNKVIEDFFYQRNFPLEGYADLQAAGNTVDTFGNGQLFLTATRQPFANEAPDTIAGPQAVTLMPNEKSTLAFADSAGTLKMLKFTDEYSFPDGATSAIRFINLSPNFPIASLSLSVNGNTVAEIANVNALSASNFINVGDDQILVEAKDGNGNLLSSINMWIGGGVAHTFYLSGTGDGLAVFKH